MRIKTLFPVLFMACCTVLFSSAAIAKKSPEEERAEINSDATKTLNKLYASQPSARKSISSATGYAVFNQWGVKIGIVGGGKSTGYAFNNKSKKKTYMDMVEGQAGLGLGVKKFALIWVFENEKVFNNFVNNGFTVSGQGNLTASNNGKGVSYAGAASVSPGVWLYQLTEKGLSAELTVKGSKYYKDKDLN
jgi:lipid-binding SYLF domain-containing protein